MSYRVKVLPTGEVINLGPETGTGLPPWYTTTSIIEVQSFSPYTNVAPSVRFESFTELNGIHFVMAQTEDGQVFDDGSGGNGSGSSGTPLGGGTVLGSFYAQLTDGGTVDFGFTGVPIVIANIEVSGSFFPPDQIQNYIVGSGYIKQNGGPQYDLIILSSGEMIVPGIYDTDSAAISAGFQNFVRLENDNIGSVGFPWVLDDNDIIEFHYMYSMIAD